MKKLLVILLCLPILGWAMPTTFNFEKIEVSTKPNWYLACPQNYCGDNKKLVTPVFNMPRAKLESAWEEVAAKLPRTQLVSHNQKTNEYVYTQRSMMFHFPDDVYVKFVDLGENQSGILMYSQARYGYYDMGVNKARVKDWLKLLEQQVA